MEARKVQHVGQSTLTVSLPSKWVREVGLKAGDIISFGREDDGSLSLVHGVSRDEKGGERCSIDADLLMEPGLLTRVITGSYIVGYEIIEVRSRKELTKEHLEEARQTTRRLTGINIVEQTMNNVVIQSFLDPTRFPVIGLLKRLSTIITSMLDAALLALESKKKEVATEIPKMEEEVDRIYWLVVRQLLLASRSGTIRSKIGISSPMHLLGNRTIAKLLESIADFSENAGDDIVTMIALKHKADVKIVTQLISFTRSTQQIYDNVVKSLFTHDLRLANRMLGMIGKMQVQEDQIAKALLSDVRKKSGASSSAPTVLDTVSFVVAGRSLLKNLSEISRHSSGIAEIVINRSLEEPSKIIKIESA